MAIEPVRTETNAAERMLNVREVAARLRISDRQVRKLARAGRIPAPAKLGGSTRWREADLDRFIAAGCEMPQAEERWVQ